METICHMGATHCVLKRKKGPMLKKKQQKNEKARLVWVKKENQGAQFVLSDKDQVVL